MMKGVKRINYYYDVFHSRVAAINPSSIKGLGLKTSHTQIQSGGSQFPSVLFNLSMEGAKVMLTKMEEEHIALLRTKRPFISLQFAKLNDRGPKTFNLPVQITQFRKMMEHEKTSNILSLKFARKAPDDLIKILSEFFLEETVKYSPPRANLKTMILSGGKALECQIKQSQENNLSLQFTQHPGGFMGQKTILLIKEDSGLTHEIIGLLDQQDIRESAGFTVQYHFHSEEQSPRFLDHWPDIRKMIA
jgi:hypothetical protein